jgi:hypothetical protein
MNELAKKPKKHHAIELSALHPEMTQKEIAEKLNIPYETLKTWRRNPDYMDAIYNRYMVEFGSELPAVLKAMVREAKSGNVQAGRLVLEHSGKLVKNINITVDSPFEKWLKTNNAEDAEIVEDVEVVELIDSMPEVDEEELPPRAEESVQKRIQDEKKAIKKAIKREEYNRKQKEWYKWKKRAKNVGMEPLKAKRPTKGQRKEWEKEIIKRESDDREDN